MPDKWKLQMRAGVEKMDRSRGRDEREKSVRLPEAPLPEGLTIMNQKYSLGCKVQFKKKNTQLNMIYHLFQVKLLSVLILLYLCLFRLLLPPPAPFSSSCELHRAGSCR